MLDEVTTFLSYWILCPSGQAMRPSGKMMNGRRDLAFDLLYRLWADSRPVHLLYSECVQIQTLYLNCIQQWPPLRHCLR